jgi:hypothetical protein
MEITGYMVSISTQVSNLLWDLSAQLPVILGKNLVGIYLYGSLTQRAFNASAATSTAS